MKWKQTEFVHKCPVSTAWDQELFYSNMYPPNATLEWIDSDTPDNVINDSKLTYTFNEYGFRSDPFYHKSDLNIMVNGCSLTVGIGICYEKTWPQLLRNKIANKTNKTVTLWNIATSGASGDYVVRSFNKVFCILKPDQIFIYWPPKSRMELLNPINDNQLTQALIHDDFFPKALANDKFFNHYSDKNTKVSINAAIPRRHKIVYWNSEDIFFDTYARDGQHPGEDWHERVAEMFYQQYINKEHK